MIRIKLNDKSILRCLGANIFYDKMSEWEAERLAGGGGEK